ncbi:MAG: hypothetical protein K0Q49_1003 [Haloplasmataceae bacterium]|jgi:ribosomal protein S18 acetylase RimI-like enzyme|nr:hypothetical protein [Haloplasmataceae bacterium]
MGIGTKLINIVKQYALIHQFQIITLETQSRNYQALCFYKKQGFEINGNVAKFTNQVYIEMGYKL